MNLLNSKKISSKNITIISLVIVMVSALIMRLYMAWIWDKDPVIMTSLIEDDSFYSLNIAKNIAAGEGIGFTQGIPTNGFQPLYVFMMVLVFAIFENDIYTPIHVALTILSIFSVMTCYVLFKIVKRIIHNDIAALLAAVFWGFNPAVFYNSIGGLEGAIEVFFVSLIILYYLKNRHNMKVKSYIVLGILFGFAILSRTSLVILLFVFSLDILREARLEKSQGSFSDISYKFSRAGIVICFSLLVLAPWIIWNLNTFGSIAQSSGQSSYLQFHGGEISLSDYMLISVEKILIWSLILFNCFLGIMSEGPYPNFERVFIGLGMIVILFSLVIIYFRDKIFFNEIRNYGKAAFSHGWFYLLFSIIIFLFYTVYLWRVSWRYFLDIILLGIIFLCVSLDSS
jgi:4-amino-4-deoxy-L-arabinose transferase-like glycosyltransferase